LGSGSLKNAGYVVVTLSMALLVVGLGLEGGTGILLNVAAILGCLVALVLFLAAGRGRPGGGGGGPAA
jgi:hypothetical protein